MNPATVYAIISLMIAQECNIQSLMPSFALSIAQSNVSEARPTQEEWVAARNEYRDLPIPDADTCKKLEVQLLNGWKS